MLMFCELFQFFKDNLKTPFYVFMICYIVVCISLFNQQLEKIDNAENSIVEEIRNAQYHDHEPS
jgi:Na+/H+ antiporter NhaC